MEEKKRVRIVYLTVNDVYEAERVGGKGGLAEAGRALKEKREELEREGAYVVCTVNGDFASASEAGIEHKGQHIVELFKEWGVDYVVAGNHEFDYGREGLEALQRNSAFHWLGSNVLDRAS